MIAAQAKLPPAEISIATANMLFFQYFGGTIVNVIGKTVFLNALGPALQQFAPAVDAQRVINAGATEFLNVVEPQYVDGVRLAYNKALALTFVSSLTRTAIDDFALTVDFSGSQQHVLLSPSLSAGDLAGTRSAERKKRHSLMTKPTRR
jgi:hypothetical protein